jgi:hypothetical protein
VDRRVCAPPHSFSQLTAAFLASVCPGIPHHALARLTTKSAKQSTRSEPDDPNRFTNDMQSHFTYPHADRPKTIATRLGED